MTNRANLWQQIIANSHDNINDDTNNNSNKGFNNGNNINKSNDNDNCYHNHNDFNNKYFQEEFEKFVQNLKMPTTR